MAASTDGSQRSRSQGSQQSRHDPRRPPRPGDAGSPPGWSRRAILRVGKRARAPFDRVLARYSAVGDPAVFDPARFPALVPVEGAWKEIRDEAAAVLRHPEMLPPLRRISPDHERIAGSDAWKSYILYGYGFRAEANCARCPRTVAWLEQIPDLFTALFSVMSPGGRLKPHRGVSKAIITCHLPLWVPAGPELCGISIDGTTYGWHEGRWLVFDDTRRHSVWNDTDAPRVVLLLHLRRPLRFPGSLAGSLFLEAVRRSPFIRDARRNQAAWDAGLEAGPDAGSGP